jgi:hypothetical protein
MRQLTTKLWVRMAHFYSACFCFLISIRNNYKNAKTKLLTISEVPYLQQDKTDACSLLCLSLDNAKRAISQKQVHFINGCWKELCLL